MPANGETPHLMHVRWAKLRKDLYALGRVSDARRLTRTHAHP